MTDFKIGDKVKITGNTNCSVNEIGDIGTVAEGPNYNGSFRVEVDGRSPKNNWTRTYEMEIVGKYSEGDILKDEDGDFYKVLGVGKYGVELTEYHSSRERAEQDDSFQSHWPFNEIKGWALVGDVKEVTLEEVAKKFKVSVSDIRIKD